ncbi:iron(III) transport system ATP-binding protein [Sphingopyxis italica]|uniref:Iron(III) transport system ATP-binding protein n=1 Tax=Sphingopyxis italica TaxID=1129133 RepID=A0A7X5XTR1_9SPHN|nr:ABC transporter ATP-binding protein [Sphingopyxis italica]NJB90809.1 iron(III) transport system ATP-binding protein [Sphingopyxis italica]
MSPSAPLSSNSPSASPASSAPILEVADVARLYPGRAAVEAASLTLAPGRVACLLGPSGCGKSTLLRMIAGLEPVDRGAIRIHGAIMSEPGATTAPEQRGVGLVFQDNALFPHLDVRGNIGFGIQSLGAAARRERVAGLLARLHIDHLADAWPHMLSGGEQQRVAIARALAREPALLLLDEPFSGLDGHLRGAIRDALLADLRAMGTSVMIVTHDPEEAMALADDLILMSNGRILQTGTAEDCYRYPASPAAARLLGEVIVLSGSARNGVAQTVLGAVEVPGAADGPAEILLRPEALSIGPAGAPATVMAVRFVGNGYRIHLESGALAFSIRQQEPPPAPGEHVFVTLGAPASASTQTARPATGPREN